jgi:glyceraldehyde 3-phosphate dehydrogenase
MTKKIRVAINGFGRIGRAVYKIAQKFPNVEIVAVNELAEPEQLAQLLNYDSVYGKFLPAVKAVGKKLVGKKGTAELYSEKDPGLLPWKKLKIDVVFECTGRFRDEATVSPHLKAGAKKVIVSTPVKDKIKTIVLGVNDQDYKGERIINNASCTTNCAGPVMSVLEEKWGIEKAFLSTIHSYTADQALVDGFNKDPRRARSAGLNIVPTSTGAAIAVTKTIPSLTDKFDGVSFRVPTPVGSLCDIVVLLKKPATVTSINQAYIAAAKTKRFKGIMEATNDPLVSTDIVGNPHSAIVDLGLTQVIGGNLVKIIAWYDNEWGYANRLVELAVKISK